MHYLDENQIKELLKIHLQKDKKIDIYYPRVDSNLINGKPAFNLTWSWWGFFGGWAFFLYRKMYLLAAVFFILSILTTAIPFGGFILALITGASAFYFYTSKFYKDLEACGYGNRDVIEVKHDLEKLGGYNSWVVFLAIIFYSLIIIFSIVPLVITIFAGILT